MLDIRWPVCIIIYVVRRAPGGEIKIGDLCNGSTPDSDSVCGGSNPSSPAIAGAKLALLRCFFCTQGMKIAPCPCTRRHASVFCMSLRASAHTCGNPFPRRETWQVGNTLGKSVALFRIRPKYRFLLCPAARRTDCHVASLLAMTVGRCHRAPCPHFPAPLPRSKFPRTRRAPRPCTREHLPAFCPSLRGAGRLHRDVAIRVPAGAQNEKQYLRRIPNHLRICPNRSQLVKYLCGDADCHVASLLAMTCRNMRRVRMATTWCRGKFVTLSAFAKGTAGQPLPPCPRIHYQANQ